MSWQEQCREPKTGQQKFQLYYKDDPLCLSRSGLGISSFDFRANRLFFVQKLANERFAQKMSDSLIRSFAHSSERPERIAHGRSFLVIEMSDSLTSLI